MLELAAADDGAGIGKGRHPAAVFQARVPADMIPVQVGAHHVVDILDPDPRMCEVCCVMAPQPVKLRPGRALLVIAEAGIDEDGVTSRLHDEAVKTEDELARRRVDQPGSRHVRGGAQYIRIEIGKENVGGNERPFELGDALYLEIADERGWHFFSDELVMSDG